MPEALLKEPLNLLSLTDVSRKIANGKLKVETKSSFGQYMTPATVASFMASLFPTPSNKDIRLLDPGAGVGSLTSAFVEYLCKGKIGIYLDLKDAPVPELVKIIQAKGMEKEVIWYVGGKNLTDLKSSCPECFEMPDPGPEKNLAKLLADHNPRAVASVWEHFSKTFVETCHKAGAIVICDEDGTDCWKDMLAWGTDGIQTDHPADLIKYLQERQKTAAR